MEQEPVRCSLSKSIKTLMWLSNERKKILHICESKHYSFLLSGFVAIKLEILGRTQNGKSTTPIGRWSKTEREREKEEENRIECDLMEQLELYQYSTINWKRNRNATYRFWFSSLYQPQNNEHRNFCAFIISPLSSLHTTIYRDILPWLSLFMLKCGLVSSFHVFFMR